MDGAQSKRAPQPRMVDRTCAGCGKPFQACQVDVARGWGKHCSRACSKIKVGQVQNPAPDVQVLPLNVRSILEELAQGLTHEDRFAISVCSACGQDASDEHRADCIVLRAQLVLELEGRPS